MYFPWDNPPFKLERTLDGLMVVLGVYYTISAYLEGGVLGGQHVVPIYIAMKDSQIHTGEISRSRVGCLDTSCCTRGSSDSGVLQRGPVNSRQRLHRVRAWLTSRSEAQ